MPIGTDFPTSPSKPADGTPTNGDTPADQTPDVPVGPPEATYRSHAKVARDMALASLCLLVICGMAAVGGLEAEDKGHVTVVSVFAVGLFAVGAGGLARELVARTRLGVYGNGVLVETLWSETFTRWEDIEAIFEVDPPSERNWFGVEVKKYRCGFSQTEGRTFWFHINRMSALRDFAARLHERADNLIRARTHRALAAGEVAWFGYIGIGRDGVHSRKGVLPWAEVAFAGCVHDTHFEVLKRGSKWGWFSRKVSEVENVAILTEFMRTWKEWALPG